MNLTRILAVLAAANMVAAFALATLLSPMLSLAHLISMMDGNVLVAVHDYVVKSVSPWVWNELLLPVLLRPSWLLPICLGIVLAGCAMTAASRKTLPRSHRRRS